MNGYRTIDRYRLGCLLKTRVIMDKKALFYLSDSQTELITAVFYRSIDGILTYTLYARGAEKGLGRAMAQEGPV